MRSILRNIPGFWLVILTLSAGIIAVSLGDGSSKAFSNIGGAIVIRVMGSLLVLGALSLGYGIFKRDGFWRSIGCVLLGLGFSIYGAGVIIGLKSQGLLAGHFSFILAGILVFSVNRTLRDTTIRR